MKNPSIRRSVLVIVAGLLVTLLSPLAAHAQAPDGVTCRLPKSNAEGLETLSNYYPGY